MQYFNCATLFTCLLTEGCPLVRKVNPSFYKLRRQLLPLLKLIYNTLAGRAVTQTQLTIIAVLLE